MASLPVVRQYLREVVGDLVIYLQIVLQFGNGLALYLMLTHPPPHCE